MRSTPILAGLFSLALGLMLGSAQAVEHPSDPTNNGPRKSATSVPRESILAISSKIDSLVESKLQSVGQQRNELASDEIFLRRIYLDAIGRIPTLEETKSFLNSKSKNKRAELIDKLLDSYGYTSRQFNFWSDLLRIKSRMPGGLSGVPYANYVKDAINENVPYDDFVRDMINSSGANFEEGKGAVGYYLRDRNMPEDNMSNTIRVFLGTRLECAQCHDHPFDKWTQRQYFEMVAFTGGINYRDSGNMGAYQDIRKEFKNSDVPEKLRQTLNRMSQTLQHGISGGGTGLARLPENFLGDDGFDGEIIVAKEMFEGKPLTTATVPEVKKKRNVRQRPGLQQAAIPGARDVGSREIYANWLTDAENPRFATVIANRLWKQAMGVGLIEPVDIIEDGTVASNQELMEFLAETMTELDFDMKQFLRAIYNTETYQAVAYSSDISDPNQFYFNGPTVRRMGAEQIWDSLLTLTIPNVDRRNVRDGESEFELYDRLIEAKSKDEILKIAQELAASRNKKRPDYQNDPEVKKLNERKAALAKQIKDARRKRDAEAVRELMVKSAQLTNEFRRTRGGSPLQRASELQSPAPAGHFLREFGQSDREVIDNANTEPSVTQVLAMMNGLVEEKIARDRNSVLMQAGIRSTSGSECVEAVFLSMLNREPSSSERRVWAREFDSAYQKQDQTKIFETFSDLIWTLANSNEFIFVK